MLLMHFTLGIENIKNEWLGVVISWSKIWSNEMFLAVDI